MKISFSILLKPDASEALARDPVLGGGVLDLASVRLELDDDDPKFDRLLEVTRHTTGGFFTPYMTFTAAELAAAKFLQVDCRGKILNETSKDTDQNRHILKSAAFQHTPGRSLTIKLVDRIALTKITIAPNAIGCATDWMPEFVVPRAIADAFREEGLTGFETKPVVNGKADQQHADFFLLYSSSIMPDAERNVTTIDRREQREGWRALGVLTYDFSNGAEPCDFNRTAEDFGANHLPLWIVSQRVREVVTRRKFKGWAYRPVLEKGTPLHSEYTRMWSEAIERISVSPNNRL